LKTFLKKKKKRKEKAPTVKSSGEQQFPHSEGQEALFLYTWKSLIHIKKEKGKKKKKKKKSS
jgi:hypothetical protein